MATDSLPLLELFTRLRDSGMPLGIDEYQLALKAMSKGFGVGDRAALLRLCETLWTKTEEEKQRLAYHFEQLMPTEAEQAAASQMPVLALDNFSASSVSNTLAACLTVAAGVGVMVWHANREQPMPTEVLAPETPVGQPIFDGGPVSSPAFTILITVSAVTISMFKRLSKGLLSKTPKFSSDKFSKGTQVINDEIEAAQAHQRYIQRNQSRFLTTGQYLPITQRQMKQSWRYLSRPVRQGMPTELDVEATIQRVGQQGMFLEPVLVPPRTNCATLLLLVDQDGSMVPFRKLTERLVNTAQHGGRFGMTHVYYFHNCPAGYLYRDAICLEEESLYDVFDQLPVRQLSALIVSDAGAARHGYNPYRIKETRAFLDILFQRVRHTAWLNPMSNQRWSETTAGEIAQMIPMFGCDRAGLDEAIKVLRGRES